mmetsp:Transcript_508/g.1024  ORF Transcript_508/g.1024 Transcript_508/m.1024 type:complete len:204 (+) Transcript_508:322-933(+)
MHRAVNHDPLAIDLVSLELPEVHVAHVAGVRGDTQVAGRLDHAVSGHDVDIGADAFARCGVDAASPEVLVGIAVDDRHLECQILLVVNIAAYFVADVVLIILVVGRGVHPIVLAGRIFRLAFARRLVVLLGIIAGNTVGVLLLGGGCIACVIELSAWVALGSLILYSFWRKFRLGATAGKFHRLAVARTSRADRSGGRFGAQQ